MQEDFDGCAEQLLSAWVPMRSRSGGEAKLVRKDLVLLFCKFLHFGSMAERAWLSCFLRSVPVGSK